MKRMLALASIYLAIASASQANAVAATPIPGLFNTGVDNAGQLLPNATADPHYALIVAPGAYPIAYAGDGNDVYPWLADGPNSRWIGASTWLNEYLLPGNYTYRTTFDLSGMNPGSASLNLNLAADNSCDVFLNGVHTGITTSFEGFTSFSSYSITTGFITGVNTLDFQVYNGDVPAMNRTGLRVELSGSAMSVPEPTVAALGGLAGAMLRFRRRQ